MMCLLEGNHGLYRVLFLLLFSASLALVPGEIVVTQANTLTTESWTVRGIASFDYTSPSPPIFVFQCVSPTHDQDNVSWKKEGSAVGGTQSTITNGIQLSFSPPLASNVGTYICSNSVESVQFILTGDNPASLAAASQQSAYTGDSTVINIYASTLAPLTDSLVSWTLNGNPLTDGTFSNSKTTLTISNVQPSDAGVYRLTIMASGGGSSTSSSDTTLTVLALPTIPGEVTIHTDTFSNGTLGNISWTESTVDSSIGGRKYRVNISSSALEENIIMESTSNSVMVEGLVPSDDQYCVVVTAIDGNGKASNGSDPVCFIFNVPSPVDDVVATHSQVTPDSSLAQVIVSWNTSVTTPSNVAIPDMNGYRVTLISNDYSTYSGLLSTDTFNHTFTNVPVGSSYTVSVVVVNAIGNSEAVSKEITLSQLLPVVSSSAMSSFSSFVIVPILVSDLSSPSLSPTHSIPSSQVIRPSQPSSDCRGCITVTTTYETIRPSQHNVDTSSHTEAMYTRGHVIPTDIVLCSNDGGRGDKRGASISCIPHSSNIIEGISSSIPGQSVSIVVLLVTVLSTLVYLTIGLLLL